MKLASDDPRHGTTNGYGNLKCRCQPCRDAWSANVRRQRESRPPLAADDPRHGRTSSYQNHKCRCDACRQAFYVSMAAWYSSRVAS